jgi:hypothetical protein
VTPRSVESRGEVNEVLSSWHYEGLPLNEVQFIRNANGRFDKDYTALIGAMETLGLAGERDLEFSSRDPDFPDLHVLQRGKPAYVEATEVRREGRFFAKLWEVQQVLADRLQGDEAFRAVFGGRTHGLSFVRDVHRRDVSEFCNRFVEWAMHHDWAGQDDVYIDDPWLSEYAPVVSRRILSLTPGATIDRGPTRPLLTCGRLGNAFAPEDFVPYVLDAIETKKAKRYRADAPIWLAVTAAEPMDALVPRVAMVDVDPGQFARIYVSDAQDVVTYEVI